MWRVVAACARGLCRSFCGVGAAGRGGVVGKRRPMHAWVHCAWSWCGAGGDIFRAARTSFSAWWQPPGYLVHRLSVPGWLQVGIVEDRTTPPPALRCHRIDASGAYSFVQGRACYPCGPPPLLPAPFPPPPPPAPEGTAGYMHASQTSCSSCTHTRGLLDLCEPKPFNML